MVIVEQGRHGMGAPVDPVKAHWRGTVTFTRGARAGQTVNLEDLAVEAGWLDRDNSDPEVPLGQSSPETT